MSASYPDSAIHRYTEERMTHEFAVFNLHCNDAGNRADAEFIAQFGQRVFDRHIAPSHKEGIMSIFDKPANRYRVAWVTLVTAFVNEHATEEGS